MPQTTGAMTMQDCRIFISNTSAFPTGALDISGISNELGIDGGELSTITAFTFGTSTPILRPSTKSALSLNLVAMYTENAADGYSTIAGWYENSTPVYVQYQPKGAGTGNNVFTTDVGYITSHPYPAGNAEGAEFATYNLKVDVQSITRSTAATGS